MNAQLRRAVLLSMLAIAGCGGSPRLDTTTKESLEASMKAMTAGMSDAQKREFAVDTRSAIGTDATQAALKSTFSKDKAPGSQTEMYKTLNGLTVAEIHAKAEENRLKNPGLPRR